MSESHLHRAKHFSVLRTGITGSPFDHRPMGITKKLKQSLKQASSSSRARSSRPTGRTYPPDPYPCERYEFYAEYRPYRCGGTFQPAYVSTWPRNRWGHYMHSYHEDVSHYQSGSHHRSHHRVDKSGPIISGRTESTYVEHERRYPGKRTKNSHIEQYPDFMSNKDPYYRTASGGWRVNHRRKYAGTSFNPTSYYGYHSGAYGTGHHHHQHRSGTHHRHHSYSRGYWTQTGHKGRLIGPENLIYLYSDS